MTNARYIPQAVRNAVAKRDKGHCYYCQVGATRAEVNSRGVLTYFDDLGRTFHLDHRLPVAKGGKSSEANLVLACAPCNLSRRKRIVANDPEVLAIIKAINKEVM